MKKLGILFTASLLLAFTSCNDGKRDTDLDTNLIDTDVPTATDTDAEMRETSRTISVVMEPKSDSNVRGEAFFREENGVVRLEAKFSGLTPGKHAIHLHESSDCSAADGSSAGGHWNPTMERHGKWGDAEGYHKGDIGNFDADDSGNGSITFETDQWCIGCGDENRDILSKSVIVHEGVDDFVSQPTGDAGGRLACGGVIE